MDPLDHANRGIATTNEVAQATKQKAIHQIHHFIQDLHNSAPTTSTSTIADEHSCSHSSHHRHHLSLRLAFLKGAQWSFVLYLKQLQRKQQTDTELTRAIRELVDTISESHFLEGISIDWQFLHFLHLLDASMQLEQSLFLSISELPNLKDVEICGKRLNSNTHVTWPTSLEPLHRAPKLERLHLDERGCLRIQDITSWNRLVGWIRQCVNLNELYIGNLLVSLPPDGIPLEQHSFDGFFLDNVMENLEHLCIKQTIFPLPHIPTPCLSVEALRQFLESHPNLRQLTLRNLGLHDEHCQILEQYCGRSQLCQLNLRGNRAIGDAGCMILGKLAMQNRSLLDLEVEPTNNHHTMADLSIHMSRNRARYAEIHPNSSISDWAKFLLRLQQQKPRQFADIEFDIPLAAIYLSLQENPHIFETFKS